MASYDKMSSLPLIDHEFIRNAEDDAESARTLTLTSKPSWFGSFTSTKGSMVATLIMLACFGVLSFIATKMQAIEVLLEHSFTRPQQQQQQPQTSTIVSCGSTPDEARAAGCHFDMMNFGWFPPQCWDGELYDEVSNSRNWTWTTKDNKPVSVEEAASGNHHELLTTWDFHLIHCVYAWRKLTRAVLNQRPLDEWSARYMHAKHCGHELLNSERFEADAMITLTTRWYPKCGLDQEDMMDMLTKYHDGDETGEGKEVSGQMGHHHHHEA